MKLLVVIILSCFAFFANAKQLPTIVHQLNIAGFDKPAHALIFAVLTYLCLLEFPKIHPLSIVAVLVAAGLLKEVGQGVFTNRSFCIYDFLSDCYGIFTVYFFTQLFNIQLFMKKIFTIILVAMATFLDAQCPNPPCTLPVSLTYFKAEPKGATVQLTWATEAEKDAAYFSIERGETPSVFSELTRMACNNKPSVYQFVDDAPLSNGAYYRLSQIDLDGKREIFKAVYVENSDVPRLLYGNVVSTYLFLTTTADVQIFDTLGRVVAMAQGVTQVFTNDLPNGIYIARITKGRKVVAAKILKF